MARLAAFFLGGQGRFTGRKKRKGTEKKGEERRGTEKNRKEQKRKEKKRKESKGKERKEGRRRESLFPVSVHRRRTAVGFLPSSCNPLAEDAASGERFLAVPDGAPSSKKKGGQGSRKRLLKLGPWSSRP
jgi:hypothetical protein